MAHGEELGASLGKNARAYNDNNHHTKHTTQPANQHAHHRSDGSPEVVAISKSGHTATYTQPHKHSTHNWRVAVRRTVRDHAGQQM